MVVLSLDANFGLKMTHKAHDTRILTYDLWHMHRCSKITNIFDSIPWAVSRFL